MAKYKYNSAICPQLPDSADGYAYKVICGGFGHYNLLLSNTAFVWAVYAWPNFDGLCQPEESANVTCYTYNSDTDKTWWKNGVRHEEGGDFDSGHVYMNFGGVCWSNVNIYRANSGELVYKGSVPTLYCPDPPSFDHIRTIGIIPALTGNMNKYLYSGTHVHAEAVSSEGATVHLQLYCNGSLVAHTSGSGSAAYGYKGPQDKVATYEYHATAYCTMSLAEANSESVSSNTVFVNVIEYDLNDYDPVTGTDKSGQLTPGGTVPTSKVDLGDSTVNPSDDVYQEPEDPITGEVDWGDGDDGKIDITEDDPEPNIKVDDITQEIILKDGVGAMSYYLGYRHGKMIRGQMNGFDDVDAELINGVLYIRDAPAEQTDTLLEVT